MKNILYEDTQPRRLPRQVQLERVRKVVEQELTPLQRQTLIAYYFQEMTITQIARERGVQKSTVARTLRRAEEVLKRYLKY